MRKGHALHRWWVSSVLGGRLRDRHLLSLRFAGAPSEQREKMKMSNVCAQPYLSVGRFWTNRNLSQHPESFALRKKTSRGHWMDELVAWKQCHSTMRQLLFVARPRGRQWLACACTWAHMESNTCIKSTHIPRLWLWLWLLLFLITNY